MRSFLWISYIFTIAFVQVAIATASSSSTTKRSKDLLSSLPLHGINPDKFVASAPLIVAAVCREGVAIAATHTASLKEPLLIDDHEENNTTKDIDSTNTRGENASQSHMPLHDLPLNYRGPFRIQSVDGFATTLTCAGWRTDGEMLATAIRSLASSEQDQFGEPYDAIQYGQFLAQEASTWMAKCAVSDHQRALSCVGLLATSGRRRQDKEDDDCCYIGGGGGLWLVDATGAYRVRAHAVGLGANVVNRRLQRIDFSTLTLKEAAVRLLETMTEAPSEKEQLEENKGTAWKVPINAHVEVAVAAPLQRTMERLRLDKLLL